MDQVDKILKDDNQKFTKKMLANEIFVKGSIFGVVEALCQNFSEVQVIENYGNYMKITLDRQEKTIGFLFQILEALKEEH